MVGIKLTIQLCLVVLFLGQFVEAKNELRRLDKLELEEVATILCKSEDKYDYIAYFSLLTELRDFITSSKDPKFIECWSKYGDSIELAIQMISTSTKNICHDSKIALIEEFHNRYISMNKIDTYERESKQLAAPQALKTFVILYVQKVLGVCKNVMALHIRDLESTDELITGMTSRQEHVPFDDILDKFSQSFMFELSAEKQKYMFMFWNLVEDIAHESREKVDFSKYVDLAEDLKPGQVYRVTAKIRNTDLVHGLQDFCRQHLQPIYSRTILPVLRLVDLGYYLSDIGTVSKRWYKATQLCDTILPIRFVADASLTENQVVLVPKNEVDPSDEAEVTHPELAPMPNSYLNNIHSEFLPFVIEKSELDQLWKDIKTRKDVVKRCMSKISSRAFDLANQKQGSFFLASKSSEGGEKQDFTEALGESMTELSEPTTAEKSKEKIHGLAKGLMSGMKKAAHYAKLAVLGPLKVIGSILAIIVIGFTPDFTRESEPYYGIGSVIGNGGGRSSGMPVTLMAVPAIG